MADARGLQTVVRRFATLALFAITALACFGGALIWRYCYSSQLTSADLHRKAHPPAAPRRLKEGCSELRSAIDLAGNGAIPHPKKLTRSAKALDADEVTVYRTVLGQAIQREGARLNVSAKTVPLGPGDFRDCECFQDIYLEDLRTAFHSFHALTNDVLPTKGIRLVDSAKQSLLVRANDPSMTIRGGKPVKAAVAAAFATGLFSLSEVAFDKEHRYAVVSYSFWCGLLCGNGATVVLEKVGGEWKVSDRRCSSWVS